MYTHAYVVEWYIVILPPQFSTLTCKEVFATTPCLRAVLGGGSPANECKSLFSPGPGLVAPLNFLTCSGVGGWVSGHTMHSLAPPPRGVTFPAWEQAKVDTQRASYCRHTCIYMMKELISNIYMSNITPSGSLSYRSNLRCRISDPNGRHCSTLPAR